MRSQFLFRYVVTLAAVVAPVAAFAESSVRWRSNLDAAKIEATQSNRLLLLHFTRKSCGPCKYLDDHVFSQPHVGPAVEQHYVPVRIDADASPALANSFRIDRVPTEIILTSQGEVVANLPIPDKADAYLGQLQNVAQHYAQTTAGGSGSDARANVNSAYAKLPVATPANDQQAPATRTVAAVPTNVQAPQTQGNPFVAAAKPQPTAAAAPAGQGAAPATSPITPTPSAATANAAATYNPYGTITPATPANAMPNSYRKQTEVAATTAPPVPTATTAASTAPAATATAAAAPPQLPAGAPPLGFDGCCPVTLKTAGRWTPGNPALGVVHRGRTYLFASETERQQFWADPDAYSPVFAGLDPVLLLEKQQSVEGTRRVGGFAYGGLFYLFSSEETKQRFAANPASYAAGVRQAMNRIDAADGGILRR
jgi:YHS domain-containing protein/thioredoxin-related protein